MKDNVPKRTDAIYKEIEGYDERTNPTGFKEYEYTNCIAYEMAIRNDIARKIIIKLNKIKKLRSNLNHNFFKIDKFTRNKKNIEDFFIINNEMIEGYLIRKLEKDFGIKYNYNQLKDGKVKINRYTELFREALFSELVPLNNRKFSHKTRSSFVTKEGFLIEQIYNRKKEIKSEITTNFKKMLELGNISSVKIKLNLNLPKDELVAFIREIKDEYDNNKSIVKNPLELLGKQIDKAEEIKSKALPKDTLKRKKAMASAFYVYDIYKILEDQYRVKKEELILERDNEIKQIKQSKNYQKIEKETIIQNLKDIYQDQLNQYSKTSIKIEISLESRLSLDDIERYRALMNKYIDGLKYKELITGISN
jgi:hypothetical protein